MRWLSIAVVLAAVPARADKLAVKPPAGADKAADKHVEPHQPDPITAFTNDPVLGKDQHRVDGEEVHGVVAFTFDDGPNPETTPAVIDALEKYDIPATFFIITSRIAKHNTKSRDVLARELAGGFLVGSHSVTHPNLKAAGGDTITKEIDASFRTLSTEANRQIGLFRPPYGALSGAGRQRLKSLGVTEVIWSIDTLDWKAHDAVKLRKKVHDMIVKQNGGIVLMHDVKPITAKIIADVFDDLEADNCQRLADKKEPIWPVTLHYFLKDGKDHRPVPADVQRKVDAYKAALPGRCAKRPKVEAPTKAAATPVPAVKPVAMPAKREPDCLKDPKASGCRDRVGDFPHGGWGSPECLANPLALGCN